MKDTPGNSKNNNKAISHNTTANKYFTDREFKTLGIIAWLINTEQVNTKG